MKKKRNDKKIHLDLDLDLDMENEDTALDKEAEKGIDIVTSHNEKLKEDREERIYENKGEKKENREIRYKIRPLLVAFITVIIITIIYVLFEYGPIFGINISKNSGISEESKINIITGDEDIYRMYNQELLVYSDGMISTYNQYLNKTWSYEITEKFTPSIYINDRYMAIVNNSNGTIYMFDNKKEIFNKKIDGQIQYIYIDNYGNIAVEYSTTGYKKIIGVYDKNGTKKFDTYLSSEAIIDIEIFDNAKKLLIVQAESTTFKIGVSIQIVDSTKTENNITELWSESNTLLYDIRVQGQNAILLLDNKIAKLDLTNGNAVVLKDFTKNQLLFSAIHDNYYICTEKILNDEKNQYVISMNQYDGLNISTIETENSPKELYSTGLLNYFVYEDKISVINKWGIEIKVIPIDSQPKEIVIFNNEKSIALFYTNKVYIVNI